VLGAGLKTRAHGGSKDPPYTAPRCIASLLQ
jgi:hypothetical protein